MAFTTKQIYDLDNMNVAAQNVSLGTVLSGIQSTGITEVSETVSVSQFTDGGATVGTWTSTAVAIPVGATVLYASVKSVTGFAGDTSAALTIGDGTDVDRYNTSTINVFATAADGISAGAPSGTVYHAAAKTAKLTITSAADFTAVKTDGHGSITYSIYYLA